MFTFALVVGIVLACISASLYCQSDVRPLSPECDDQASPFGRVEALPVERPARPSTGKNLFAVTDPNRTEQPKVSERTRIAAAVPGSVVAAGEPLRTPAATPTDPFSAQVVRQSDAPWAWEREGNELVIQADGRRFINGVEIEPDPSNVRQMHPSTFSERWWAKFQAQDDLVPRRPHLTLVEHENRLARAASEFTERDPANPRGIRRPIIEEDQ